MLLYPFPVQGVSRSSLITSYNWLAMELKARNRCSFSIYAIILSHTLWVSLVLHLVYFCLLIFPAALFPLVSHIVCIYLCSFPLCFVVIFVFSDPLLRPLAFSGPPAAAVAHAERYLGDMLRRQSPSIGRSSSKEIFYPNFNPPHILGIVHHSNQIISSFLMESIVG